MKVIILTVIVMVSMVAGHPDKHPFNARQEAAPYAPRGWRPAGPQLNLPNQPQKQTKPPAPKYGPPPAIEATTNQTNNATEPAKVSAAVKEEHKNAYFLVLPKREPLVVPQISQNLVYPQLPNQAVVALPQSAIYTTANIEAVPAYSTAYYAPLPTSYVVEW